jgi:hypothetical protein
MMNKNASLNKCVPGINDLASTFPNIAVEADGWDPSTVARGSSKVMPWRCQNQHTWSSAVVARTGQGQSCPFCAGQRIWPGFNDLKTTHPELASQLVDADPTTISKGSGGKHKWLCDNHGHEYLATVSHRREGKGCPYCSGNQILVGFNDFATTHPEFAEEAIDDPKSFSKGTNKKIRWRCTAGHVYEMYPSNRLKGENCGICIGRIILKGFNDLATSHPVIAAEAFGWDPTTVGKGHFSKLEWKCEDGHVWSATPNQRTSTDSNCPFCSGQKAIKGESDLATTYPHLLPEIYGWDPSVVKAGSKVKKNWKCHLGHVYSMTPHLRTFQGSGCPYCSNNRVLAGFNDLATKNPEVASEAYGWDPTTLQSQSALRRRFKCTENHIWAARISDRTAKKAGCPTCAKTGFDPNEPGYFYLLRDDLRGLFQLGISNDPESRLATHMKNGWEVMDVRGPMDGQTTRDLESQLLRFLREQKAKFANKQQYKKFDGWSESWVQSSFQVSLISELIGSLGWDD